MKEIQTVLGPVSFGRVVEESGLHTKQGPPDVTEVSLQDGSGTPPVGVTPSSCPVGRLRVPGWGGGEVGECLFPTRLSG